MAKLDDRLNDILQLEHDAVNAYETAIKNCDEGDIKTNLTDFLSDHTRHVSRLTEEVSNAGGKPASRPDLKGPFLKGLTAVMSKMGDRNLLRVMHQNENLTNSTYDHALKEEWPSEIRAFLIEFQSDERRHRSWIEQRLEEMEETEARPEAEHRPGAEP